MNATIKTILIIVVCLGLGFALADSLVKDLGETENIVKVYEKCKMSRDDQKFQYERYILQLLANNEIGLCEVNGTKVVQNGEPYPEDLCYWPDWSNNDVMMLSECEFFPFDIGRENSWGCTSFLAIPDHLAKVYGINLDVQNASTQNAYINESI